MKKWSEPLKWRTKLGIVSGKGNDSEETAILPEISANGCRTHGDGANELAAQGVEPLYLVTELQAAMKRIAVPAALPGEEFEFNEDNE
jgi:hypothetical protein